jgi:hypothetical protein
MMMMTEMDIETSVYYVHLTWLIAREDFIKNNEKIVFQTHNKVTRPNTGKDDNDYFIYELNEDYLTLVKQTYLFVSHKCFRESLLC